MTTMASAASLFERNKRIYLDEESKLHSIVCNDQFLRTFQAWLDQSISQLDFQYERCEQQLSELQQHVSVPKGAFWNSKAIIEHCNLHMAERRLTRRGKELGDDEEGGDGQHAQLPDLIQLVSALQQTKSHSFITAKQRRFIEQCENELKSVVFEARDLTFITNALQTKLIDDGNTRGVFGDLTAFQNTIEELSPDIDQCEQLLEASIANGEMGLAEDISKRQLEVYEHILRLITDQYPIISNYYSESRNSDRRRRWAVFRMADRDITAVIESKHRQIEACEEDMLKIQEQMTNYNEDDAQQRKRYDTDRTESDQFLQQNKEKQQSVWNRVFALFQELQTCSSELTTLAEQRRKEVERRLQMEEREAGRRSGHESFLQAAAEHAQKLQDTIDNAAAARDVATALNDFVLDGCDSIAAKYDKQQNALSEMLRLVQQHHFKRFSDYYIAASRYLYRKERRLEQIDEEMSANDMQRELFSDTLNPRAKEYAEANQRLALRRHEVVQEVMHVRHKLERAERAVTPTLRSLDFANIAYVHPREIVEKMNLSRWSTMLDYRTMLHPAGEGESEVQREAAAIEELRTELDTQKAATRNQHLLRAAAGVRIVSTAPIGGAEGSTSGTKIGLKTDSAAAASAASTTPGSLTHSSSLRKQPPSRFVERVHAMLQRNERQGVGASSTTTQKPSSTGAANAASGASGALAAPPATSSLSPSRLSARATNLGAEGPLSAAALVGPAPPPSHIEGATFQALFSYRARAPDELTFEAGQQIICISRAPEEGWFRGVCNQRTGLFPINYVEPARETSSVN
ncbi:paraflagellar rod protein-like protein [Leptomonas pyrrhocoris]|uniref:Paraflagellar rod protein-like protein n=1 Tax=Leptomonas pyrrhocoris TaxID=157538 RepID=A0A0N0VH35_LEPPY|nr:paraflagellar rod protein-like protein [Leptomonas pyrrhocoris]XP_015662737.1 paraflagellar rod protein-like protein [Leptomonas pyrrhocoris]KPA84297.1 paraflagellar rod protein-like protein [Leptomonas pyrrhocoris]KPA84298.1 paraflagellar rod protein-like protein [Leptomonas pyrrhocoris]|eukprot:XP_015662736.1 paraflagellar rod protein-like protein [Leptomonas pyrrhocoris]